MFRIVTLPSCYRSLAIKTFWEFFKTSESLKVLQRNKLFQHEKLSICSITYINDGTTLCSSVMPLEEISRENI